MLAERRALRWASEAVGGDAFRNGVRPSERVYGFRGRRGVRELTAGCEVVYLLLGALGRGDWRVLGRAVLTALAGRRLTLMATLMFWRWRRGGWAT